MNLRKQLGISALQRDHIQFLLQTGSQVGIQPAESKTAADLSAINQDIHIACVSGFSPRIRAKQTHALDAISRRNRMGDLPI